MMILPTSAWYLNTFVSAAVFGLVFFNNITPQEDFQPGDKVVVEMGPEEFEGVVVKPGPTNQLVEVKVKIDGETQTIPFMVDMIRLVESSAPKPNQSGGENELRYWTDATGKFKVKAQLVTNKNGKIELKKEDGRVVTLPLKKLSDKDQRYLEALAREKAKENDPDNPFAGGVEMGPVDQLDLRRDAESGAAESANIEPEFGTNTVDLFVDSWTYKPDAGTRSNKLKTIRYKVTGGDKPFFDQPTGLKISLNKKMAATVIANSFNKVFSTVVIFDLEKGKVLHSSSIPLTDVQILAVSNDGKQVATVAKPGGAGASKNSGMTIWKWRNGRLQQHTSWQTAKFGDRSGFKPVAGAFLDESRLITIGKNVILWDIELASDFYTIDGIDAGSIAFSANNRRFAFQRGEDIYLADTLTGQCQGVLETPNSGKARLAFSQSGQFLAVLRIFDNEIRVWDLENQEIVREFATATPASRSFHWVGDEYLLVNGMDLYDIALRVPVWRYVTGGIDNLISTNDGRFWLLEKARLKAIRIPDKNLAGRLGKIDPDSLLVLQPGDEVELQVNKLPFPRDQQDEIYEHLASQLEGNGVSVQSGAELKLVTTYQKLKRESMDVRDFFAPVWHSSTETLSFTPTNVSVQLVQGEKILWTRSSTYRPGHHIQLEAGETAQQAADRLCQADASFFMRVKIPKKISQLPGGKPLGQSRLFDF